MSLLWGLSLWRKDASLVDRFWGIGFCVLYFIQLPQSLFLTFRGGLVLILVLIWGLRLSLHIHFRNRGHGEDRRYQSMRAARPSSFWWVSLFQVYWLQGTLLWLLSAPLLFILLFPQADTPTPLDLVGATLWLTGFLFESIADYQLARFKRDPKNQGAVCRIGLWGLSRHPNYFGEAVLWWGFWTINLNTTAGWYSVYSPLLMTYLLLKVSGVSLLEKELIRTKPGYENYIRQVPAFFPWRSRRS